MSIRATDKHAMREIDVMLYNACAKGSVQEVERLVGLGADPSAPHWEKPWPEDLDENLYTEDYYCVHEAAQNADVGVLDALVRHGADPNMREYWGRQPLAYAGRFNSIEMVRRLVELGNDPGNCDDDGGTVLSWAALNPDSRFPRSCPQGAVCGIWREDGLTRNGTRQGTKERRHHEHGRGKRTSIAHAKGDPRRSV